MTDTLIESIRVAAAEGATAEARIAGADACRTLLAALDVSPGQSLAPAAPSAPPVSTQVAMIATELRGMPVDQLADVLIAKLRTLVPVDQQPTARSIHIPLVGMPR
jgi:hypothetical protein